MAYTTESLPQAPAPTQAPPEMREERVFDPYKLRKLQTPQAPVAAAPSQPQLRDHPDMVAKESAEESASPAETVKLSPAAAALARKEQAFRRSQQELKAKEAALEAERAEIAELKALKAKIAAKDYAGVEKFIPYDEYTNYLIEKDAGLSPEHEALRKVQSELEAVKKAQQDDVSKRFEAAVGERRRAVNQLVESSAEFSSIKELQMQEAVVQHILDTWEHDSIDLSVEDAAKEVEELLIERAGKWTSLSKLKAKETSQESKELPPLKPALKTLTNNMAATGEIKRPQRSFHGMSDAERYAEARRRAEEKLRLSQRG